MGVKEDFHKAAPAFGIHEVSAEMECLLSVLDGGNAKEAEKDGGENAGETKDAGDETAVWKIIQDGSKWDVVGQDGVKHAEGNNLTKKAATALADKLNAEK